MKALLLAVPVVVASLFSSSAQSEEKVIKLKLVVKMLNEAGGGYHYHGVTFQQNGTVGSKDFFVKESGKKGHYVGLSTYTFPDGSVTAAFNDEEYGKGRDRGTYVILAGTGIYEGAKGTGSFDGVGTEENEVKGIGVYDVTLNVTVPPRSN
jgi:hypothetical protein